MKNIIVVNLESVHKSVYEMLPRDTRLKWEIWEQPEAYSRNELGNVLVTGGFFKRTIDQSLIDLLHDKGYTTYFSTEWEYNPTQYYDNVFLYPLRFEEKRSWFDDWLAETFDYYINYYTRRSQINFKTTLKKTLDVVEEPFYLVQQAHDTHLPFYSMVVADDWYNWYEKLESIIDIPSELVESEGISDKPFIGQLCTLCDRGKFSFTALENYSEVEQVFREARMFQVRSLEYVMNTLYDQLIGTDTIFHFIGDHATCLGEHDLMGNVHGRISYKDLITVPWITNQQINHIPIEVADIPTIITEALNEQV